MVENTLQASFLSPEDRQLAQQTFETAVKPLRKSFEERTQREIESLSGRGLLGGQLAEERFRRSISEPQLDAETQLAGTIATDLGKTALERAFQANENAKSRQLSKELQGAGFEFSGEQANIDRQIRKNEQAINLALNGNLSGQGVTDIIKQTFGSGTILTDQDTADLQRVAQASGLSVDEFNQMRQAIGQGQLADILQNPQNYIDSPEKQRQFQMNLANISKQAAQDAARTTAGATKDAGLMSTIGTIAGSLLGGPAGSDIGQNVGSFIDNTAKGVGDFFGSLFGG